MKKFLFTFIILLLITVCNIKNIIPYQQSELDKTISFELQKATCEKHGNIWIDNNNECFYK